jgi:acetolactate synthase I/II/III large subunit
MRVADYIIQYIHDILGVDTIFSVSGGGIMFLTDAIGQNPNVKYVGCHHEQAATMAASAYARYTGKIGVCIVTTGCGGTNALTGVLGAFQDRIPMLIISGQVKTKECIQCSRFKPAFALRQFGVQEADIVSIVKPIVAYVATLEHPYDIDATMNALVKMSKEYNAPVWLDVPIDIQGAEIEY